MLGDKMIMEKWRFWRQEKKGKTKSPELKQLIIVFSKEGYCRYKIGDSTRKLSHNWQAKSRTDSCKAKVRGPWDGKKKPLLSLPSNANLVINLKRSTKALLWKGAGVIIFFGWTTKIYFFQLLNLKKYYWAVPAHQVIKKLKMVHLWLYTLYPTPCRNGYRMW